MLPLPRGAVWQAVVFLLCAVLFVSEVRSEGRVVCYYTNWSVYRPGTAKFNPQNINPYLCTHLVYAFGGFTKDNQMKPFDKYQDIEQGGYAKFTGLKTYNKQLKTMIAIGGWNEASSRFSPLVASPERRQKFIKNILKFLRQNHFDGIDLDWEYPAHREGGKPRDRDNYAQFVQELRAEFERESEKTGRPRLLITMAVPAGIEYIEKGYDIPKLNKYLDWFNLLTYDFHSSHEPSVNHHAPLYSLEEESEYNYDSELNIDYSLKFYLKAGADRDKLVLGIPTYGRSFTLINEESTEIGSPSEGPGEQGDATREKGYLAYYEICQNIKDDPEWTVIQPNPNAMGPYAYRRNQWVGYDDEDIVRKKAQYVVEHGLGGIMFWAIDNDDFRGTCTGKPYPLIEAAKEAMLDGLGLGINEVSKPSAPKKPLRSRSRENSSSSSRNRINDSERKEFIRRPVSGTRKPTTTTTTTEAPRATIRLTEAEGSSLYIGGRTTTPPPPTTPDPGTDFKCEEEGFFQHPRDCKKYYWCLDSGPSGLGIVGHQFTCPSGLYFNPAADSCDFARNVPCKIKKSTTAAPVTTTSTTPRTTTASNRVTAATSRNSFLRTTTRRTTTTTTEAPEVEEAEYEEEEENEPTHFNKDRDPEEDPKVIKELIDLIRKVGGIEELEKHLLRKEDGSISLKEQNSFNSDVPSTPSTIAKTLYDKVLSRPNTYNSFRNRLTSSTLYKNTAQTKTADFDGRARAKYEEEDIQEEGGEKENKVGRTGYSKYSSVVRGNSRQGPQNEGLDKLPELEGFLKEKKQYVTINRNRGSAKTLHEGEENEEENDEEDRNAEVVDEAAEKDGKKLVGVTSTPAYSTIRRTKPTTEEPTILEDEVEGRNAELNIESNIKEKKTYATLNRSRGRFTTTELPATTVTDEIASTTNRYKYFERARPTKPTSSLRDANEEEKVDQDDATAQEDQDNILVQISAENDSATQKSQTTRLYASIGRRTTIAAPTEIPTTATIKTNSFETSLPDKTPEPILTTTTTSTTTPTSTTTTTTNLPELIASQPTIKPITPITSIAYSAINDDDFSPLDDLTTISPTVSGLTENSLDYSPDLNSLSHETLPTTKSSRDNTNQDTGAHLADTSDLTTARTATKTSTSLETRTDTDGQESDDKVNNLSNNLLKTQYKKYTTTRTSNLATTTTTEVNENESSTVTTTVNEFKNSIKSSNDGISSNSILRGNNIKYSGGRRQSQPQITRSDIISNRKFQNRNQQTSTTTTPTTELPTSTPKDFLDTVSSPRPFGFPRRRTRPTLATTTSIPSTDEPSTAEEDESGLIKTTPNTKKKYQFNRSRKTTTRLTTTSSTTTVTPLDIITEDDHLPSIEQVNALHDASTVGTTTTESTLSSSPASTPRRVRVLKYRRPVGFTNTTLDSPSINATSSVTNNTDTTLNSTVASSSLFTHVGDSKLAETVTHSSETAQTKTETPEIPSDATQPSKRLRKVIRKLKRPLNKSDVNDEGHQSTTKASIESSTVSATTFGLKRPSSNGYEPRRLKLNQTRYRNQPERDSERQNIVSNIARGNARFSLPNGRFDTERITVPSRGPLFGNGNRRRFGSQGQVTSTEASNIKVGVESEEKDYIDQKDKKEEDKMEYTTEDLSVNKTQEAKLETSSETLASLSIDDSTTENAEVESTTERTDKALEVSEVSSAENIDESTTEQVEDAVNSDDKADGKNEGKIYNRANVSACSNNGKEGCKSNGENDVENDSKTDENKPGFKNDEKIHDIEDDRHDHKSDDDSKKGLDKDNSEIDPNVGVIQLEKSSESKKVSKETSQLQKIRNRIRNEHEKSTTDSDKISSRFKNILREKNNGTKDKVGKGKTTITNGSLDLQKIRSKVKSAQNKGNEDEGVINTRLRKLLLEKAVSTSTTTMLANEEEINQIETTTSFELDTTTATPDFSPTQYLVPSSSQELANETWADHELEKIQTTPFTDDLEATTPIAETSSENSLVNSSKNDIVEANNESATTQMVEENDTSSTAGYDVSTTTTPNPSTRRKFVPSSRSKKVTTFTETTTITTAAPIARPTLRRKLISKKPYLPSRSSLTLFTSTQRALSTTKSQKFFPRKFGNFQRNKGTANTGQTSIGTNGRNSRLPGISRFETRNSQRYGSTESYESIEDDYYDDDSEHEEEEEEFEENKPVAPAKKTVSRPSGLFNRQPIFSKSNEQISYEKNEGQDDRTDDGDGIEDEDEDEDSGDDDDDGEEGDDDDDAEEDEDATTSETPASRDSSPSPLEVPPASRPAITQSKSGGNVPFNPKNRLPGIETNSSGIGTGRYANHLRIANRPKAISALTLKTVALDLETTTLPTVTRPAPFIPTYTPTYERKYIGPSTTDSSEITVDNSLEDLNIEAINARNKKIFDINSKKHTTLKPKILTPPTNSDLVEQQQPPLSLPPPQEQPQDQESPQEQPQEQLKEQALPQEQQEKQQIVAQQKVDFESQNTYPESRGNGFITTTVPTPTKPTDTDLTNSISNEISSQDRVELSGGQQVSTTQETPTTTLQHVFTLTDDDVQTNRPPTGSDKSTPPRQSADRIEPKHKVVEINRIVEVTSKEDKLRRKSKANQELSLKTVGSTSLRVESLPHIEQLGEISVVKYVHLVNGDDIVVDGHSTVADYTPTEDPIARSSLPIRNSVPEGGEHESTKLNVASTLTRPLTKLMTRYGKSVVPEVILEAVETSTIPLEGLFDSTRKGKELNPIENLVYDYISGESQVDMDERRTIDTVATLTSTDLVNSSRVAAPSSTNTLHKDTAEVSSNPTSSKVAIASEHPATAAKPSTVAAALFPAYVRPIVPLLRPESNESSPLVISIANLDKVVLSKVMKTDSVPESAEPIADSSAEYSSRHAAIIKPLTNRKMPASGEQENSGGSNAVELPGVVRTRLGSVGDVSPTGGAIQYDNNDNSNSDDNNHNFIENKSSDNNNNNTYNNGHGRAYNNISNVNIEKVKSHSSVSAVSGSSVSEVVSFHSETHVVHKKRSRKHKSKKSRKSKKATTAFEASDATTTEASASNDVTTSKALAT